MQFLTESASKDKIEFMYTKGSTYPDLQFLGNFREKSKKFPTPTVSKKLSEISPNFPQKLRALLPDLQLRTGNFCRF